MSGTQVHSLWGEVQQFLVNSLRDLMTNVWHEMDAYKLTEWTTRYGGWCIPYVSSQCLPSSGSAVKALHIKICAAITSIFTTIHSHSRAIHLSGDSMRGQPPISIAVTISQYIPLTVNGKHVTSHKADLAMPWGSKHIDFGLVKWHNSRFNLWTNYHVWWYHSASFVRSQNPINS